MITKENLINSSRTKVIPIELQENMNEYLTRINQFFDICKLPAVHTSFYRSKSDQIAIYREIGKSNPPMHSQHLYCRAGDVSDKDNKLKNWITENLWVLEKCNLWCEDFAATKTWVHFQTIPPKSGKRFFIP